MIREMTDEDVIRSVHHKYEIPEETVKHLLSEGVRSADIDKAALISCLSGKEIGDILAFRKEQPCGRIKKIWGSREPSMKKNTTPIVPAVYIVFTG